MRTQLAKLAEQRLGNAKGDLKSWVKQENKYIRGEEDVDRHG